MQVNDEAVTWRLEDGVAHLVLNRPYPCRHQFNAATVQMDHDSDRYKTHGRLHRPKFRLRQMSYEQIDGIMDHGTGRYVQIARVLGRVSSTTVLAGAYAHNAASSPLVLSALFIRSRVRHAN